MKDFRIAIKLACEGQHDWIESYTRKDIESSYAIPCSLTDVPEDKLEEVATKWARDVVDWFNTKERNRFGDRSKDRRIVSVGFTFISDNKGVVKHKWDKAAIYPDASGKVKVRCVNCRAEGFTVGAIANGVANSKYGKYRYKCPVDPKVLEDYVREKEFK